MKLIALGDNSADLYRNTGETFPGGNAVNVAVHAARQGAGAEYLGCFGDDGYAKAIQASLLENGVEIGHCTHLPRHTTKVCRYDVANGERSFVDVITGPAWAGPILLDDTALAHLAKVDIIASSCNAKLPGQLAAVQALPPVFAYDFGEKEKYRTDEYYDLVCHKIDLAMFSCRPMPAEAFAALCAPLHRRGVVHVLATMGAQGQLLSDGTNILQKGIQSIDAYDTMGAGDSFLAAFLCTLYQAGWRKGRVMPPPALYHALAEGQRVSAQNCQCAGGFGRRAEFPANKS